MKIVDMEATLVDFCGSDLSIVNAARVSFNKESEYEEEMVYVLQEAEEYATQVSGWIDWDYVSSDRWMGGYPVQWLSEKDVKLIYYLAKHKHLSPFNHCFISTRIKVPIFVARQLVKHEYMPWNEVSRRYVDSEPEFYIPDSFRIKADNVKQGSGSDMSDSEFWKGELEDHSIESIAKYNAALENGMCPEQARIFLPHNLMTECFWSGTLGAFGKMLSLRLDSHTQYETRLIAEKIRDIVMPLFPIGLKALLDHSK